MKNIALFATENPIPGVTYAEIPVSGSIVYVRAEDVSAYDDPLEAAHSLVLAKEGVLNTIEIDDAGSSCDSVDTEGTPYEF